MAGYNAQFIRDTFDELREVFSEPGIVNKQVPDVSDNALVSAAVLVVYLDRIIYLLKDIHNIDD